jgi:sugar phosphate isomerase/epimerase
VFRRGLTHGNEEGESMFEDTIRIGTLVGGNNAADTIRQILPHGFESFSITFWQTMGGADIKKVAREVNKVLDGTDAVISSVAIFGNPLGDTDTDKETRAGWRKLIDNAHLFGCDIVAGFAGRVRGESIDKSMPTYKKIFTPLAKRAADKYGLKSTDILIELGRMKTVGGQEDMIEDVALDMKKAGAAE